MVRYDKNQFPARYSNGVFIAFHGSFDRAPYAQGGYNMVFQPLQGVNARRALAKFLPMVSPAPTWIPPVPSIVPPASPWARMGRSMFPTTSAAGSIGLCTRAVLLAVPRP